MIQYSKTLDVGATPDTVFRILADVERWPEWTSSMQSVKRQEPGPLDVGSRALVRQPKLRPALWTVTVLKAGRNFTWSTSALGLTMRAQHLVEPASAGSRVTLSFDMTGWMSGLIARFYGKLIEEYLGTEAAGLKRAAETA